jgi:hypothetical protein
MQQLERALHDLAEQDERLDTAEIIAGVELRRLADDDVGASRKGRWGRRPLTIGFATAAAAIILIGAVPLGLYLLRTDKAPPVGEQPPVITAVPTAPSLAATVAPSPTTIPTPGETAPPVDAAPDVPFGYAEEGTPAGTLESVLGNLSWYTLDRVSYEWIEAGVPGPYGRQPDRDFWQTWNDAHSGLEVFEIDVGYLGLGSTANPDEPRIMLGYRDNLFRVRGVETREGVEQWDMERGVGGMEFWGDGSWWGYVADEPDEYHHYFFAPREVWFSEDGTDWRQFSSSGLGDGVALASQPGIIAHHDGSWMIVGRAGVEAPLGLVAEVGGSPAAWTSSDLATWTQVPFDFSTGGTDTVVGQVVASERGWLVVGHSRYDGDRPTSAASLWVSNDAVSWEEIPVEDITGIPGCPDWWLIRRDEVCHMGVRASFVPGGIAVYVDHWLTDQNRTAWTLWLGVWDD